MENNINPTTGKQWFSTCIRTRDKKKESLIRDTTGSILHLEGDRYV